MNNKENLNTEELRNLLNEMDLVINNTNINDQETAKQICSMIDEKYDFSNLETFNGLVEHLGRYCILISEKNSSKEEVDIHLNYIERTLNKLKIIVLG